MRTLASSNLVKAKHKATNPLPTNSSRSSMSKILPNNKAHLEIRTPHHAYIQVTCRRSGGVGLGFLRKHGWRCPPLPHWWVRAATQVVLHLPLLVEPHVQHRLLPVAPKLQQPTRGRVPLPFCVAAARRCWLLPLAVRGCCWPVAQVRCPRHLRRTLRASCLSWAGD